MCQPTSETEEEKQEWIITQYICQLILYCKVRIEVGKEAAEGLSEIPTMFYHVVKIIKRSCAGLEGRLFKGLGMRENN